MNRSPICSCGTYWLLGWISGRRNIHILEIFCLMFKEYARNKLLIFFYRNMYLSQVFLTPLPVYCCFCRGPSSIHLAMEKKHNLAFHRMIFWINLPGVLGFPQLRWPYQGSSSGQNFPGTPEPAVFLPRLCFFLSKITKSNKKHFGGTFEAKSIPPPEGAATDGECKAGRAWLPAGVWVKWLLGQLG